MWSQNIKKYIYQYQQLIPFNSYMLKADNRHRSTRDPVPSSNPPSLSKPPKTNKSVFPNFKYLQNQQNAKKGPFFSSNSQFQEQKENKAMNQNTPKLSQPSDEDFNSEDMDQLSQIKFISKECSSIKQNHHEWNSQTFSGNHLEDFSPLFDRSDKNTDKDQFILEIQDISEEESSFSQKKSEQKMKKRMSFYLDSCQRPTLKRKLFSNFEEHTEKMTLRTSKTSGRGGKIKKNKIQSPKQSQQIFSSAQQWIDKEIMDIFEALNSKSLECLSKVNCSNENLSTELNYFIGSIITKIKVRGKSYDYSEFREEFKILIEDTDPGELEEILLNQRNKKSRGVINSQYLNSQQNKSDDSHQLRPSVPLKEKPSKDANFKLTQISEKLTSYLSKNNLIPHSKQMAERESQTVQKQKTKESAVSLHSKLEQRAKSVKSIFSEAVKSECSLRSDLQVIRGIQGQQFSLVFTELNKHM